ncbi:unnamed protein product [Amaranthus hypochondriacus]
MKRNTIDSYFSKAKRTCDPIDEGHETSNQVIDDHPCILDDQPSIPIDRSHNEQFSATLIATQVLDDNLFVRDPALHKSITSYPPNKQQEVIATFVEYGPYRLSISEYPPTVEKDGHVRRFQAQWFKTYNWLTLHIVSHAFFLERNHYEKSERMFLQFMDLEVGKE